MRVASPAEGIEGFFGASSAERLPTEIAITQTMRRFKSIPVHAIEDEARLATNA